MARRIASSLRPEGARPRPPGRMSPRRRSACLRSHRRGRSARRTSRARGRRPSPAAHDHRRAPRCSTASWTCSCHLLQTRRPCMSGPRRYPAGRRADHHLRDLLAEQRHELVVDLLDVGAVRANAGLAGVATRR